MAKSLAEIEAQFWAQYQLQPDEEAVDEEIVDKEIVDKETVDKETVDKKTVDEETVEAGKAEEAAVAETKEAETLEQEEPATKPEEEVRPKREPDSPEPRKSNRINSASIISDIIFYFALIAMILCAVIFSQGGLNSGKLGGYHFYEVLTTSMESIYPRGCLVMVKQTDPDDLNVGDDVTYYKDPTTTITHRIVEIKENYQNSSKRGFVTKGVDNAAADSEVVPADNIVGKVRLSIPYFGAAMTWLASNLLVLLMLFLSLVALSFFLKYFFGEKRRARQATTEPSDQSGQTNP